MRFSDMTFIDRSRRSNSGGGMIMKLVFFSAKDGRTNIQKSAFDFCIFFMSWVHHPDARRWFWASRDPCVGLKSLENLTCRDTALLFWASVTRRSIPVSLDGIHTFQRGYVRSICAPTRYSPAWTVNNGFMYASYLPIGSQGNVQHPQHHI